MNHRTSTPAIPEELLRRYDVPAPRYTSYPTVPVWRDDVASEEHAAALQRAGARASSPLSLYVHLPFCRSLCSYCGCNVVVAKHQGAADDYLIDVERELSLVASLLGSRRTATQLHWGGGTPTFLSVEQIDRLWTALTRHFSLTSDAEIAIEIDPRVTSAEQLRRLRTLGFNRVSLGVQDFDADVQTAIGRGQTLEQTRAAFDTARSLGFGAVNVDLVYGLPLQTSDRWRRTLDTVLALRPDRLALFSFAYLPSARPNQRRLPVASLPTGADKLELYQIARERLLGAGYRAIGLDHFALPTDELLAAKERGALRRNFQGYTAQSAPEVVAFGVTGISQIDDMYVQNVRPLPAYRRALAAGRLAPSRGILLSQDDVRRRDVIMQLMCAFQVDLEPQLFAEERAALQPFVRDGLVQLDGDRVTLTPLGQPFVRTIAQVFDAYAHRHGERPPMARAV